MLDFGFYNMDCMQGMKKFPDKYFDLAICDPPYGGKDAINPKSSAEVHLAKRQCYHTFDNVAPTQYYFDELKRVSKRQIIWGVNFFDVKGLSGGRIVWDKHGTAFGRAEIAYYSHSKSVEIFDFMWNGMLQGDMKNKEFRIHPTQKPVRLYEWLLANYAKPGEIILDTHVGSGSSLVACRNMNFKYVGFEIDETYFKKAKDRIEQHAAQMNIFDFMTQEGN